METKVFEIRDHLTFFPAIAISTSSDNEQEQYLLSRAGYASEGTTVIFFHAHDIKKIQYSPYHWRDRTYQNAHKYIKDNWDKLEGGEVIDVQYILGETDTPKVSEAVIDPTYLDRQGENET